MVITTKFYGQVQWVLNSSVVTNNYLCLGLLGTYTLRNGRKNNIFIERAPTFVHTQYRARNRIVIAKFEVSSHNGFYRVGNSFSINMYCIFVLNFEIPVLPFQLKRVIIYFSRFTLVSSLLVSLISSILSPFSRQFLYFLQYSTFIESSRQLEICIQQVADNRVGDTVIP